MQLWLVEWLQSPCSCSSSPSSSWFVTSWHTKVSYVWLTMILRGFCRVLVYTEVWYISKTETASWSWALDFEIWRFTVTLLAKKVFFSLEKEKMKFYHSFPPHPRKTLMATSGKIRYWRPGKILSTSMVMIISHVELAIRSVENCIRKGSVLNNLFYLRFCLFVSRRCARDNERPTENDQVLHQRSLWGCNCAVKSHSRALSTFQI